MISETKKSWSCSSWSPDDPGCGLVEQPDEEQPWAVVKDYYGAPNVLARFNTHEEALMHARRRLQGREDGADIELEGQIMPRRIWIPPAEGGSRAEITLHIEAGKVQVRWNGERLGTIDPAWQNAALTWLHTRTPLELVPVLIQSPPDKDGSRPDLLRLEIWPTGWTKD